MLFVTLHMSTGTLMIMVNMHKAKSTLSQLVEAALAGEEVIISRRGIPAVQIVPLEEQSDEDLRPMGLGVVAGATPSSADRSAYTVADEFADDHVRSLFHR